MCSRFLLQGDVVDQSGGADADRGGESGWVERGDGDVVDVEARRLEDRSCGVGIARRERAREGERARSLLGAEVSVPGRERQAVRVADRRHDGDVQLEVQVGDHPPQHLDLLGVLPAEEGDVRADDREQLQADRGHAAEVTGTMLALEHRAELRHLDPRLVAGRVELGRRGGEDDVDTRLARDIEVVCLVPGIAVQVGRVAELRRVDEQAHHDRVARRPGGCEQRAMAVVERAHRRHEADPARRGGPRAPRARRRSSARRSRRRSLRRRGTSGERGQRVVGGKEVGRRLGDCGAVPLDGLPVPALDRPGELESVVDHAAHERLERLGRHVGRLEELARRALEGDEVVRGDRGAGVVERTPIVGERERPQPEGLREPPAGCGRLVGLAGHRGPGPVELVGAAVVRERLQRMDGEAPLVRRERGERRAAARVRHPGAGLDARGDPGDRAVGHAEEDEIGVGVVAELDSALAEPRAHRASDAPSRPDDDHAVDHSVLQFLADTGLLDKCNEPARRLLPVFELPDAVPVPEAGQKPDERARRRPWRADLGRALGDRDTGSRAVAELVEQRLRVVGRRRELSVDLAQEPDQAARIPGEEPFREQVAHDGVVREQAHERGDERPAVRVGDVAEDALQDDHDALAGRVGRKRRLERLLAEADRNALERVARLRGREPRLLDRKKLGLVDLDPASTVEPVRPGVEPATDDHDARAAIATELLAEHVVDHAVPNRKRLERPLQRAEPLRDSAGVVVHEALGVRVVRDGPRAGRVGMARGERPVRRDRDGVRGTGLRHRASIRGASRPVKRRGRRAAPAGRRERRASRRP